VARLRIRASALGIEKLEAGDDALRVVLHPDSPLPTDRILALVGDKRSRWRLGKGGHSLVRAVGPNEALAPVQTALAAVGELSALRP
jgi:hypothetical protein